MLSQHRFHTREAVVALLKMAQTTSDHRVAANCLRALLT
jgi:hypothetical protein